MVEKYIFVTSFNTAKLYGGPIGYTQEWISTRLKIFMEYTRKSLECQTNQDFLAIYHVAPCSEDIVRKELSKYEKLPDNIVFTTDKYKIIRNYLVGADRVYCSVLHSDDMYRRDFVQYLHDYIPSKDVHLLIHKRGYAYNMNTGILEYYKSSAPNFYTQIFEVKDYLGYVMYYGEVHHAYQGVFTHDANMQPMYMLGVHDKNTFRSYHLKFPRSYGEEQVIPDWKEIMESFGLI